MSKQNFDVVILNGRPAAGKSEIIDYLKHVPTAERLQRFHIGEFEEIDDFPYLWERFQDDDVLEKMGKPRMFSETSYVFNGKRYPGYTFKENYLWNFFIRKLDLAYSLKMRDDKNYHDHKTLLVEFSRGSEHGGFQEAYKHLSDELLKRACVIYIKVSFEESLRKNRRRFNPDRPDSWLEHGLEDTKLELLYKESDWEQFSSADPNFLIVRGIKIPYAVFDNEPEKTDKPEILGKHLEEITSKLWKNWYK
ncbi:MAG: hypothetical protein GX409_07890 [candidate division Zixibacteria bacterium]|nr:hypothetical protein [candidate division Zixibacteria bacterium]